MKTSIIATTFSFLIFFISCGQKDNRAEGLTSRIKKITVAFSAIGCESDCSNSAISIDSTLNLNFYAGWGNKNKGFYQARIGQDSWDSIRTSFDKFIINGIDTTIEGPTDQPIVELIISDNEKSITYKGDSGRLPIEMHRALIKLKKVKESVSFQQVDSIPFETVTQYLTIPVKHVDK